jgi:RNA recognition motif-containing protein
MPTQKLFVANIPYEATADELGKFFQRFGTVISTKVIMDKDTDQSRGFGFVELKDGEAPTAIDGRDFNGRKLCVREATERRR